jgi:hypothetical protein
MKIDDWNNLEKLGFRKIPNGYYRRKKCTYYKKRCPECKENFLGQKKSIYCSKQCAFKGERNGMYGKHLSEEARKRVSEAHKGKIVSEETKQKLREFNLGKTIPKDVRRKISESLKGKYCGELNGMYGKHHTEETKRKLSEANKGKGGFKGELNPMYGKTGEKSSNWKGGYKSKNLPLYDTYAPQIEWCEEVRRNKNDLNIMEVRCTHCNKWFVPKQHNVKNRLQYLNGNYKWENRFYCSKACKNACPLYKKSPEQLMKEDSVRAGRISWLELDREVQAELRQMVLERDCHKCTKCGSLENLHCHHILPVAMEPLLSADIDNCITLCEHCHKEAHSQDGCKYGQLRIEICQ